MLCVISVWMNEWKGINISKMKKEIEIPKGNIFQLEDLSKMLFYICLVIYISSPPLYIRKWTNRNEQTKQIEGRYGNCMPAHLCIYIIVINYMLMEAPCHRKSFAFPRNFTHARTQKYYILICNDRRKKNKKAKIMSGFLPYDFSYTHCVSTYI